jgi:hypothetical protein
MKNNWKEILSWQVIEDDFTKVETDKNGDRYFYNDKGQLHRLTGPAIEWGDRSKSWYVNGKRHRLDGPAVEGSNGYKSWFVNNKRHRLDGPAVEYSNGDKVWFVNGKRHRLDGPAYEDSDGSKIWYVNDEWIGSTNDGFTEENFEKWKKEHPEQLSKSRNE